jgi:hypothetical protein
LGVIGVQYRQPLNAHRQQTSVLFNNGRPAGRKDQIADLRRGARSIALNNAGLAGGVSAEVAGAAPTLVDTVSS